MKISRALVPVCASLMLSAAMPIYSQNPILPMWEYIPDGEPYVFEDPDCPGQYRVYLYGSHDSLIKEYCGKEQVVWSAPVNDLSNWRYDGVIFKSDRNANGDLLRRDGSGDVLYAPDVTMKINERGEKEYYLYPNNQAGGRNGMIAKSNRPDGPFTVCNWSSTNPNVSDGVLGFDPAVFVDDDGRVYGYWGFEASNGAELDPVTMATVKPGTQIVRDMVSNYKQEGDFRFFEASSIRKIEDKYVFIYSRYTHEGEFGLPTINYTLAYAYSDNPLGPFTYGGTIIDGRGRETDENGQVIASACPYGNTHGSIVEINGQWWVFYHRQTGTDEYSRQAMVAPITVKVQKGKGGKVQISEGEFNSEGFMTQGLDPLAKSAAGWACYHYNPKGVKHDYPHMYFSGSYIQPTRQDQHSEYQGPYNLKEPYCPVVNNTGGSIVGYKYYNFNATRKAQKVDMVLHLVPEAADGTVTILLGAPKTSMGGKVIGSFQVSSKNDSGQMKEICVESLALKGIKGKQPLYFSFQSPQPDASVCSLYDFQFVIRK